MTQYLLLPTGHKVIVDEEDFIRLRMYSWSLVGTGYVARREKVGLKKYRTIYLHKEIMGNPSSQVDHINHDRLDNRKLNLRRCTPSQNSQNRRDKKGLGIKGVSWHKTRSRWQARITIDGLTRHIGYFKDLDEARAAYNLKASELFGDFAYKEDQ